MGSLPFGATAGVGDGGLSQSGGRDWGQIAGAAGTAAGGVGGIVEAARGFNPRNQVNLSAAGASSDYNRNIATQFSLDPNQFFKNFARSARSANAYENIKNFKGQTELETTPGLASLISMMKDPATFGFRVGQDGTFTGWKPADFNPATLDKDGRIVGGGQQVFGPAAEDGGDSSVSGSAKVGGGTGRAILQGVQTYGPMFGPYGMAAAGAASIISALTAPSEEEKAAGASVAGAVPDINAYNARMATEFSRDPGQFLRNAAQGLRSASAYEQVQNVLGQTELETSPELAAMLPMMQDLATYGLVTGENGQAVGWQPQRFDPTTLDKRGRLVNPNRGRVYGGNLNGGGGGEVLQGPPEERLEELLGALNG